MLDWQDIRFFVTLTHEGTLSATARALGVTHATVARRIDQLERSVGQRLFERHPGGYGLTAAGRTVLDAAERMAEAAGQISADLLHGGQRPVVVRVTATRSIADLLIAPRLGDFLAGHPDIDIELIAESRNLSLARRETDLALRLGRPAEGELLARRLADLPYAFYATAAYRDAMPKDRTPALFGFDDSSADLEEAAWARQTLGARRRLQSNSLLAQAAAARSGQGVVLLPRMIGGLWPDLVEVALGPKPPVRELWLVMRRDLKRHPRVRAVADHLIGLFSGPDCARHINA
ncbi:LysR family transcriptional regulator [Acidimangrovimonas pyrenivorans]|uniref:LysR family transcriptional regulator n=1 Tax=Acidimangrovimonas pyrenivorans TaxID=2030798 RepID=A0ABV7AJH4_9RHOB